MVLDVKDVRFTYDRRARRTPVLKGVSFSVGAGELVAIRGRSGSGKSTLFHILGGLLRPDGGEVFLGGENLTGMSPDTLAWVRSRRIGFVFQQFHLLPRATVLENILLPLRYPAEVAAKEHDPEARERAVRLAGLLGLGERLSHWPGQLSGGEQQRVAIARALIREPDILLADEPTGNLDSANAVQIMKLLETVRDMGKTVLVITHDPEVASHCTRILSLDDGLIVGDERRRETPVSAAEKAKAAALPGTWRYRSLAAMGRMLRAVMPIAFDDAKRNKTRAVLTMAGVSIGIAALFSMITFGAYARDQIVAGFEELGANSLQIRGYPNEQRTAEARVDVLFRAFHVKRDLEPLKRIFPEVQRLSPLLASWDNTLNYSGKSVSDGVMTFGVGAEYHGISRRPIVAGGTILPYHVENRSPVCLIGEGVVEKVFRKRPPVGEILFVSKKEGTAYPCRVIGILGKMSSNMEWRKPELDVIIPYTYFASVSSHWESEIHSFVAQVKSGVDTGKMGAAVRNYFRQKYGPSGEFMVDSNTLLVAQVKRSVALFTLLLSFIALITLAVGGMGINNMMLVSLAERLKEIGLVKALGATDRSVRAQFLLESSLLSLIAGIFGILAGFAAYESIIFFASRAVQKLPFAWIVDPSAILISFVSIVGVGIASGIVPALKAERLSVIEALRSE